MSNSDLFLIKNEEQDLRNLEIVKNTEIHSESSKSSHDSDDKKEENSNNHIHKIIEECFIVSKQVDSDQSRISSSEEGKIKEEDEEDGFRTPTSLDHRISVAIVCPPAPRKTKPTLKRRTPYNNCRYPLDLSKEVELLFPTSDSYQSKKKVRREEPK